jgi:ATP-dependent RNA helicase DeaD
MSEDLNMDSASLTFEDFELSPEIKEGVRAAGFKVPSPIQAQAIPAVLGGKDIVAQAHTGTGKTAAFGLPTMSKMDKNSGVQLLVIAPTRELASQVSDELYKLGNRAGLRTVTIYGGMSSGRQVDLVSRGAQIVVATPGRLLDLLKSGRLRDFNPAHVVLDEADEMLDMGFLDDIQEIFGYLPVERQTLLFSATMPDAIRKLAKRILKNPEFITVTREETTNKDIDQQYYVIEEYERDDATVRLIDAQDATKTIIFCRMKKEVDRLATTLISHGYLAKGLHGDMEQRQREEVIKSFRSGKIDMLIATDVAARGLDVSDVSHVFNYHIPFDAESYVHRIGRTGRAGKKGVAITLVTPMEFRELQRIKKTVGTDISHNMVPSRNDVRKSSLNRLMDEVKKQHINDDAAEVLSVLEEEMDISQIAFKLLSLAMEKQKVTGPEKIGIDAQKVEKMLSRLKNDSGSYQKRRGGYRGRSGGGRSQGGSKRQGGGRSGGSGRSQRKDRY